MHALLIKNLQDTFKKIWKRSTRLDQEPEREVRRPPAGPRYAPRGCGRADAAVPHWVSQTSAHRLLDG